MTSTGSSQNAKNPRTASGEQQGRRTESHLSCFAHHASHAFAADARSGGNATGAPCFFSRAVHRSRSVASSSAGLAVDFMVANSRRFAFSSTNASETTTTASCASSEKNVVLATPSGLSTTAAEEEVELELMRRRRAAEGGR